MAAGDTQSIWLPLTWPSTSVRFPKEQVMPAERSGTSVTFTSSCTWAQKRHNVHNTTSLRRIEMSGRVNKMSHDPVLMTPQRCFTCIFGKHYTHECSSVMSPKHSDKRTRCRWQSCPSTRPRTVAVSPKCYHQNNKTNTFYS